MILSIFILVLILSAHIYNVESKSSTQNGAFFYANLIFCRTVKSDKFVVECVSKIIILKNKFSTLIMKFFAKK